MVPFWGRCATHFRTYFSGDWDVHRGYDLAFDPWPQNPGKSSKRQERRPDLHLADRGASSARGLYEVLLVAALLGLLAPCWVGVAGGPELYSWAGGGGAGGLGVGITEGFEVCGFVLVSGGNFWWVVWFGGSGI